MMNTLGHITTEIVVTGLVQGVGFRPFIYRIATDFDLHGWVKNTNENVIINVTGPPDTIQAFTNSIRKQAPPAALVENIAIKQLVFNSFEDFRIAPSDNVSDEITEISPDIAVCNDCLADLANSRYRTNYAFVNCTNCGPRFTIIRDLPYDRPKTTMSEFAMCPQCTIEYHNPSDRRFHAQPVACNQCGPTYELIYGDMVIHEITDILTNVHSILSDDGVLLMKGLGGMHLVCNAFSSIAVKRLRSIKKRDGKPFAIMFRDAETAQKYAEAGETEIKLLNSWRRPIVLLKHKQTSIASQLASETSSGLNMLGIMLPYMPVHYQIFNLTSLDALIFTSGNFSSEPIVISNEIALQKFKGIADALLLHNREIYNRTDDSVVWVVGNKERVLRRSRGYVPTPVTLQLNCDGIVAFGAELTNTFCVGKGYKAIISQHIGDLKGFETEEFYTETIGKFISLFRIKPTLAAVDMHPSYISTNFGKHYNGMQLMLVQHHHAHIASCMAEHNLDMKVLGVAFDGTGYGTDGHTWGSEFMICSLSDFERFAHFEYIPMPGGDYASEEPWRMAVSLLHRVYGSNIQLISELLSDQINSSDIEMIFHMIEKQINCPLTCGAGRYFDAVAAITGLVYKAAFHAEGPMKLEAIAENNWSEHYTVPSGSVIRFGAIVKEIVDDIAQKVPVSLISAKFHNTIILIIFETVLSMYKTSGIKSVVLSGGVFQNKYLLEGTVQKLTSEGFSVYSHAAIPSNDGGIALGQLAVASKRRELSCV